MSHYGAGVVDGTLRAYYFQLRLSVEEYKFPHFNTGRDGNARGLSHTKGGSIFDRRPPVNRGNYATERPA